MRPKISFHQVARDSEVSDYIMRRFAFAFARMQHAIGESHVTLTDVNGPKGGVDKQCRIVVNPNALPPIVVSEKQSTLKLAVDRAIARASLSLTRQLKRKQARYKTNAERKRLWN